MHTVWFFFVIIQCSMDFKSEILCIRLAELHLKAFKSVLVFQIHSAFFYLWHSQEATTASPVKPQEKDGKRAEVTASLAPAKETNVDDAVAAVLSELDSIFPFTDERRVALTTFLGGTDVIAWLLSGFSESLVNHCSQLWITAGWWCATGGALHTKTNPEAGAALSNWL